MANTLKSKVVRGELVEVVESSGFFGGVSYELHVAGQIKQQSADLNYILGEFDRYW